MDIVLPLASLLVLVLHPSNRSEEATNNTLFQNLQPQIVSVGY